MASGHVRLEVVIFVIFKGPLKIRPCRTLFLTCEKKEGTQKS